MENRGENTILTLFGSSTGVELGKFDNVKNVNMQSEQNVDYAYDAAGHKTVCFAGKKNKTLTIDFDRPIDENELYKIFGVDLSGIPDKYDIQIIKYIPIRRHKKKRINKKWNKKYGIKYRLVQAVTKGWGFKIYQDGTFEFVK